VRVLRVESADGRQALEADRVEKDVCLTLASAGLRLGLRFSSLMRASFARPWDYRAADLSQVTSELRDGTLRVAGRSDKLEAAAQFEFRGNLLHCACSWQARESLKDAGVALVIEIEHDMDTERVTLPMSIYNGNPSIDPATIAPRFPRAAGASFVEEESRFPIPCANVEWVEAGRSRFVSLFTIPDDADTPWTLGVHRPDTKHLCIMAASGSVSFNGTKDENYGSKNRNVRVESGYHELPRGRTIAKSFIIRLDVPEQEGWGFRDIVRSGYEAFRPRVSPALTLDEVLELKTTALSERWNESDSAPGFLCVAPDNVYRSPPYYLWGWTGQSFKMALCSARAGFETVRPELVRRATRCVEFFLEGSGTRTKGLHYNRYVLDKKKWLGDEDFPEDRLSSRALGETFWNLSRLILLFTQKTQEVPAPWVTALRDAAEFFLDSRHLLAEGIPPSMWYGDGRPTSGAVSSAGTSCLCAVLGAYKVTGEPTYLQAAEGMIRAYWKIGGDRFDTPFSKATLDSGCEDKEAAIPFFVAAADLYDMTRKPEYKLWAEVTGDWILTWVYFWDVKLTKGSICDHYGFRSSGWPSVSVENQHLDVFFPAFEMYEFGRKHGDNLFEHMGKAVFEACSHGISRGNGDWFFDKPGRQGEQFYQTRWGFAPRVGTYPEKFREHFREFGITGETLNQNIWDGGYNPWDTSWIIVMVLDAAQSFKHGR
jgi:hypothetical protein